MCSDVLLNKISIIKRCVKRIEEEYNQQPENLNNYTKQDSIILNIQRACEASINIAMHIVSDKGLGIPQNSRDAFELLYSNGIIDKNLTTKLKSIVGFRNIALYDYQSVNIDIIKDIIEYHIKDIIEFAEIILKLQS